MSTNREGLINKCLHMDSINMGSMHSVATKSGRYEPATNQIKKYY